MPLAAEGLLTQSEAGRVDHDQEKLALVIPTLCEAENIGGLLNQIRSVLDPLETPYEILVVDCLLYTSRCV